VPQWPATAHKGSACAADAREESEGLEKDSLELHALVSLALSVLKYSSWLTVFKVVLCYDGHRDRFDPDS